MMTYHRLAQGQGLHLPASQVNCFLLDVKRDAGVFADSMQKQGVIVGRSWPIWPKRVDVSVGTEAQMLRFREAFGKAKR